MQPMQVVDRAVYAAAVRLLDDHGTSAEAEAARRAIEGRNLGNIITFCQWRQVGRTLAMLRSPEVVGSLH